MNPTTVAKQQRQQEVEALREEVTHLRELVRSLQDGGSLLHSQDDSSVPNPSLGFSLPPSKEVQGKIRNKNSKLHTQLDKLDLYVYNSKFAGSRPGFLRQLVPILSYV